ncbi:hypothetical protein PR048_022268 [Dryococelus australis]|uniref:Paramyosin n=1 Tax=Dryococelus australis TaxID=614101 RepID=A0ABQ9H0M6_9NEOP|nr:hypothetical protein PR048_022268 [Dryococelus australis]
MHKSVASADFGTHTSLWNRWVTLSRAGKRGLPVVFPIPSIVAKRDDLHDAKNHISDLTRRLHELELEVRRLENEREELTAAYKEAEAGRKAEEQRSQRLATELGQFRHEAERRLQEKDEEIEAIRNPNKCKRIVNGYDVKVWHNISLPRSYEVQVMGSGSEKPFMFSADRRGRPPPPPRVAKSSTKPRKTWHKTPTRLYEDNNGFGINFYQPMIDYLNAKADDGRHRKDYPHLPWSNERCLDRYSSRKPVKSYSEKDLHRLAAEAEAQAKNNPGTFSLAKKPAFSLSKTTSAASVTRHIESVSVNKKRSKHADMLLDEDYDGYDADVARALLSAKSHLVTRSAKDIEAHLLAEGLKNLSSNTEMDIRAFQRRAEMYAHDSDQHFRFMEQRQLQRREEELLEQPLDQLKLELEGFTKKNSQYFLDKRYKVATTVNNFCICLYSPTHLSGYIGYVEDVSSIFSGNVVVRQMKEVPHECFLLSRSKQTSIEIEQLNARVVEAETKLKTEVTRIKKKLHIQITELEMSLDVANKNNIELQKTIKKQSLTLTELQAHYDEVQRQLQVTLDQLGIAQRRVQSLTAEAEEIRGNYEQALRSKRAVELQYEEAHTRINELTTINVNLASIKSKIEQELSTLAGDYDEVTRELRVLHVCWGVSVRQASDERYQKVQVELKHTVEILHEEQERIVKIEAIKKSLEIEVKNVSVRLEEVEANAIVGGKRIISKLEARVSVPSRRDLFCDTRGCSSALNCFSVFVRYFTDFRYDTNTNMMKMPTQFKSDK